MHLCVFFKISGVGRHEIIQGMFNDPSMLDDLDFFYKTDNGRKMIFYHQVGPIELELVEIMTFPA